MKIYQINSVTRDYYGHTYRLKSSYLVKKQAQAVCAELNKKAVRNTYKILTLKVIEPTV